MSNKNQVTLKLPLKLLFQVEIDYNGWTDDESDPHPNTPEQDLAAFIDTVLNDFSEYIDEQERNFTYIGISKGGD